MYRDRHEMTYRMGKKESRDEMKRQAEEAKVRSLMLSFSRFVLTVDCVRGNVLY
jgi:hypothetical protein